MRRLYIILYEKKSEDKIIYKKLLKLSHMNENLFRKYISKPRRSSDGTYEVNIRTTQLEKCYRKIYEID